MARRKTTKEYAREVVEVTGGEYKMVSEYMTSKHKVSFLHTICGKEFKMRPNNFNNGMRCHHCSSRPRYTDESARVKLKEIRGEDFILLGKFEGVSVKTKFKHMVCGLEYETTLASLVDGSECPKCSKHRKITKYNFKERVSEETEEDYIFLEEYRHSKSEIKCKHNICGTVFKISPDSFLRAGVRCPECRVGRRKKHSEFVAEVAELTGDEYLVLGRYKNNDQRVEVKHTTCGHEYYVFPTNLLRGSRCAKCLGVHQYNPKEFRDKVFSMVGDEYDFLEEYTVTSVKLPIIHNTCGNVYAVRPHDFLKGSRCPKCRRSKGEEAVSKVLIDMGVEYQQEWTIGGTLRADFYLPKYESYIEYDGEGHYVPVKHWGGDEALAKTQLRDRTKNLYFEYLGFPYLRIPYWEFENIEGIVADFVENIRTESERQWR